MKSLDTMIRDAFRRAWSQRDKSVVRDLNSPELVAMTASLASLNTGAPISVQQVKTAIAPLLKLRRQ